MVVAPRSLGDHGTKSRAKIVSPDPRDAWPDVPRLPLAARLRGRPGYSLLDKLERRRFRAALPFRLSGKPRRSIVRREGRLQVVEIDAYATGRAAARTNLDIVLGLCERAGFEHFVVPDPNAIAGHVAVTDRHWDDFVGALAGLAETGPVYVRVGAKTRNTFTEWSAIAGDPLVAAAARGQDEVDVYRSIATALGGVILGAEWACRVERWRDDGEALRASVRNDRAAFVARSLATPATALVDDREVTTLAPFAKRQVFEPDFPIDVVYLWVDGDDPDWRARKAAALADIGVAEREPDATTDARFRDGGELKYSLRSMAQYAPWVRRVFLVTDRQVPSWLRRDDPRLTVVDHRELFGDQGRLPTFNSHAIGARLHHIDGLAEHYLYVNDDVFFGSDVTPSSFFEANGMAKFFLSRTSLGYSDDAARLSHESARRNVANLIERDFGCTPTNIFYHSPIPQRRSVMTELEQRYPDEFATTWRNQFRSHTDLETNSWLHSYYGYLTAKAMPGTISYTYIQLGGATAKAELKRLARTRDREVFCLNDSPDASADDHAFAAEWLAKYFPHPGPFEAPC